MKKTIATIACVILLMNAGAQSFRPGINKVTFTSEQQKMVGNLYLPGNYDGKRKLPVIITVGPFTQVKEQVAAVYAQKMAEAGFAALAFDFRFWGESGGTPRYFESPADKIKDIRNAVTYLSTIAVIDTARIGIIGACFGAGYVTDAVARDPRIKSFATVAAWFNDEENLAKLFTEQTLTYRDSLSMAAARKFAETGQMEYAPAYEVGNTRAAMFANIDYYGNPRRGAIPAWNNRYALISHKAWHEFNIWSIAPTITTPALFVHSDESSLPANVKRLYETVKGKKQLYWTKGEHTQFYDQPSQVNDAAAAMVKHFRATL